MVNEYEIVTPTRVNEFGEPFPTTVHFQRKKRSLNLDIELWGPDATSSSSSSSSISQAHYKLSAFGQHFFFNLTAHSGFIAPLFTVSLLGEPGVNETNFYTEGESDIKHCFYRGHINAKPEHTAVISLCSGMVSASFLTLNFFPLVHLFTDRMDLIALFIKQTNSWCNISWGCLEPHYTSFKNSCCLPSLYCR